MSEPNLVVAVYAGTRWNGVDETAEFTYRPATPEEIKEAHGKCVTCKYCSVDAELCYHPCHTDEDDCPKNVLPDFDYCNHHEPKEA